MQDIKTTPVQPTKPSPTPKTPGSSLFYQLHNLFVRKAAIKDAEAQEILNPKATQPDTVSDSLNTGKLTKLVNYIKNTIPVTVLAFTAYQTLF